jgi:glycosyltransferase involved in cell wall biosynthesis
MRTARRKIGLFCPGVGEGGPWRYLHSILHGIDLSSFDVTLFCNLQQGYSREGIRTVALSNADDAGQIRPLDPQDKSWNWRRWARRATRALPASARLGCGFFRDALRLARLFRLHPVELIHTQSTGCEESPLAAYLAAIPRVVGTFHVDSTVDVSGARNDLAHRFLEFVSNRCLDKAIAVSEATRRDWIGRSAVAPGRVLTIHNGIDPDRFCRRQSRAQARAQLGLPPDALLLAGVGRLEPVKGFGDLIAATAILSRQFPNVVAAIAGDGSIRTRLEEQARSLGLAERVVFLGFQADVNPLLDAADVFVIPSLSETLGYALLEAMGHELPAVGTAVGGIPEVIVAGETGFLALPGNSDALAAKLHPLLASDTLRRQMGSAGRQRVIEHFHERDMVRQTVEVYERQLAKRARADRQEHLPEKAMGVL